MSEMPHVTVATVVEKDGKFLMVKEQSNGLIVYNQPAGHVEHGETLAAAALRETLEETGWEVRLTHYLGVYHYVAPSNGVHYVRHCFSAEPMRQIAAGPLDDDILAADWMSVEELENRQIKLRSPLVLKVIEHYNNGVRYPLSLESPL